jgi:signal transduction histidine kinase
MADETTPDTVIIIGSTVFIFLAFIIGSIFILFKSRIREKENKIRLIEWEKQVDILTATAKAEERQKIRIASQLHDETLAIVNNGATKFSGLIKEMEKKGIKVDRLKEEMRIFAALQENLGEIIHDIVPKLFTSFGLLKALESHLKTMNKGGAAVAEFHNNTTFSGEPPFTIDDQLIVFKICREILNNLQKHANYEYLAVSLEEADKNFVLLFSHDGASITNREIDELRASGSGMGLKLLQSKALLLNAEIDYSSDAATAFIRLTIPIRKK